MKLSGGRLHEEIVQTPMVLLVESDADLRSAISSALTRADYNCDAVATPDAAILKLREHDYAYILADIDPAEEPLHAALGVQTGEVIFITEEDEPDALRKPFDRQQLLARLRHA
jgi:DNA-binding response OmpR family regulator